MNKAPIVLAHGFAIVAVVIVPLVTLPLTISLGNPLIGFYGPKLAMSVIAILLGWAALLVQHRSASLAAVASHVFLRGLSKWASAVMVLVLLAASISGDDLWTSMMGTPSRLDGALVVASLFHLMQVAHALVRERLIDARNVVSLAVAGGTIVSLVLLMEKSGTQAWGLLIPDISPGANPISTVGNVGALTNLLSVVFVLAIMSTVSFRGHRAWGHWVAAVVLAAGIAVHAGRAGVSGAVLALVLSSILMMVVQRPRWYVPVVGAAVLGVAIFVSSVMSEYGAQRVELFTVFAPGAAPDLNMQHRYATWQIGLESILNNPLFGTGTGSFADQVWMHASPEQELLLFTSFLPQHLVAGAVRSGRVITAFDPVESTFYVRNANYDKAHNYFIDIGVAYGATALVAMAILWFMLMRAGWLRFAAHPELLTASIAYLAALQFWFLSVNVDPMLYVAFGAVAAAELTTPTAGLKDSHPLAARPRANLRA